MNYIFNINNNTFNDNSCINKSEYYENNEDNYGRILTEIQSLKNEFNPTNSTYQALDSLESAIRTQNKGNIKNIIKKYTMDFTSSVFSKLASSLLVEFIKMYL